MVLVEPRDIFIPSPPVCLECSLVHQIFPSPMPPQVLGAMVLTDAGCSAQSCLPACKQYVTVPLASITWLEHRRFAAMSTAC